MSSSEDDLEIIRPVRDDDDPYDFDNGVFEDQQKPEEPAAADAPAVDQAASVVGKLIKNKATNKVHKQMKADKFDVPKTLKKSGTNKSVRISEETEEIEAPSNLEDMAAALGDAAKDAAKDAASKEAKKKAKGFMGKLGGKFNKALGGKVKIPDKVPKNVAGIDVNKMAEDAANKAKEAAEEKAKEMAKDAAKQGVMAAANSFAPGAGKMAGKQFDNLMAGDDDKEGGDSPDEADGEGAEEGEDGDLISKATDQLVDKATDKLVDGAADAIGGKLGGMFGSKKNKQMAKGLVKNGAKDQGKKLQEAAQKEGMNQAKGFLKGKASQKMDPKQADQLAGAAVKMASKSLKNGGSNSAGMKSSAVPARSAKVAQLSSDQNDSLSAIRDQNNSLMESEIRFVGRGRGGDSDEDEFVRVDDKGDDDDFEFGKITRVDSQFDEFWTQGSRSSIGYQKQLRAAEELDKKAKETASLKKSSRDQEDVFERVDGDEEAKIFNDDSSDDEQARATLIGMKPSQKPVKKVSTVMTAASGALAKPSQSNTIKIPSHKVKPKVMNSMAAADKNSPLQNKDFMGMERSISVSRNIAFQADGLDENDFHQGYLQKQQPDFFKSWQKRFFVLSQRMLKYYKTEQDYLANQPPKGLLNFEMVRVDMEFLDLNCRINLKILGSKRIFNLRCLSQEDYQVWKLKLSASIPKSAGFLQNLSIDHYTEDNVYSQFKFWRFLKITEQSFIDFAQTGDLILCTKKKIDLNFQNRNNKDYYKAYLLFRLNSSGGHTGESDAGATENELYLLPIDNMPVNTPFSSWTQFKWILKQSPSDILFRHLYMDRTEDFFQKVEAFSNEIKENPFIECNVPNAGVMKRAYKTQELVAKFYADVGVFNPVQCARPYEQYRVYDFAQKSNGTLQLSEGVHLGDEQSVMIQGIGQSQYTVSAMDTRTNMESSQMDEMSSYSMR